MQEMQDIPLGDPAYVLFKVKESPASPNPNSNVVKYKIEKFEFEGSPNFEGPFKEIEIDISSYRGKGDIIIKNTVYGNVNSAFSSNNHYFNKLYLKDKVVLASISHTNEQIFSGTNGQIHVYDIDERQRFCFDTLVLTNSVTHINNGLGHANSGIKSTIEIYFPE